MSSSGIVSEAFKRDFLQLQQTAIVVLRGWMRKSLGNPIHARQTNAEADFALVRTDGRPLHQGTSASFCQRTN